MFYMYHMNDLSLYDNPVFQDCRRVSVKGMSRDGGTHIIWNWLASIHEALHSFEKIFNTDHVHENSYGDQLKYITMKSETTAFIRMISLEELSCSYPCKADKRTPFRHAGNHRVEIYSIDTIVAETGTGTSLFNKNIEHVIFRFFVLNIAGNQRTCSAPADKFILHDMFL